MLSCQKLNFHYICTNLSLKSLTKLLRFHSDVSAEVFTDKSKLLEVMAWCWLGNKQLLEAVRTDIINSTRPQFVKGIFNWHWLGNRYFSKLDNHWLRYWLGPLISYQAIFRINANLLLCLWMWYIVEWIFFLVLFKIYSFFIHIPSSL